MALALAFAVDGAFDERVSGEARRTARGNRGSSGRRTYRAGAVGGAGAIGGGGPDSARGSGCRGNRHGRLSMAVRYCIAAVDLMSPKDRLDAAYGLSRDHDSDSRQGGVLSLPQPPVATAPPKPPHAFPQTMTTLERKGRRAVAAEAPATHFLD